MSALERLKKLLEVSKDLTDSSDLDPEALLSSSVNNTPQESQEADSCNTEPNLEEEAEKPPLISYSPFNSFDYPAIDEPPLDKCNDLVVTHNNNNNRIVLPGIINQYLRDYQREGIKWLYDLYLNKKGGILGDDMGLGKTIQIIGFLWIIYEKTGLLSKDKIMKHKKPTLIICPASIVEQWMKELNKWGCFSVFILKGNEEEKRDILYTAKDNELEILIGSYAAIRTADNIIYNIDWEMIIMDEFHTLKNHKTEISKNVLKLTTPLKYGLTGTLIQNDPIELWCLLNIVVPGVLHDKEYFDFHYATPIKKARKKTASKEEIFKGKEKTKELLNILNEYYLRRDKSTVLKDKLPNKRDIVVFCKLGNIQREIYEKLLKCYDLGLILYHNTNCICKSGLKGKDCCFKVDNIEKLREKCVIWTWYHKDVLCKRCPFCLSYPCISELQKIANHIDLLKPNSNDPIENQNKANDFINRVLNMKISDNKDSPFFKPEKQRCGKIETLCILLKRARLNKTKVLLFSNTTHLLDIIQNVIVNEGYTYGRIDGSMSSKCRLDIVNQFNTNKDPFIMLISTKAGGVGLNLTGGNIVIIFDPNWNPAWDIQAQDRSYRLGQNKDVTVYRLISTGTIEEITYYRQVYKQQLAAVATEGHTNQKRIFNAVLGVPSEYGKLFGVKNLFSYNPNGFMGQFQKDIGINKSENNKIKDDELDMEESLIDFSILSNSENKSQPFSDKSSQDLLDFLDEDESNNMRVMEHNALFQDDDEEDSEGYNEYLKKKSLEENEKEKELLNGNGINSKFIKIVDSDEMEDDDEDEENDENEIGIKRKMELFGDENNDDSIDEIRINSNYKSKKIKTNKSYPIAVFIPPDDSQSTKSSSSIESDLFIVNNAKNEIKTPSNEQDDSFSTDKSVIISTIKEKIEEQAKAIKKENENNETEDEESPLLIPQEKKKIINHVDDDEEEDESDDDMDNMPTQLVTQLTQHQTQTQTQTHQIIPQEISSSSSSSFTSNIITGSLSSTNENKSKNSSECGVDYLDNNLQTQNLLSQLNNSMNYSLVNKQKLTPGDGVSVSASENSDQQKMDSSNLSEDVSDILDFL